MFNPYFINFGCWNNGFCPGDNDLTKVMTLLKNQNTPDPEFIIISGDNYYPEKKTEHTADGKKMKKKYLNYNHLISGFECLPKEIPIYMVYGNHDYETGLIVTDKNNDNIETFEKENSCELTKYEINAVESLNREKGYNIDLNIFKSVYFSDSTLIIMIDTTIYDDASIDEYLKCYNIIDQSYTAIDIIRQKQKEFIKSTITTSLNQTQIKNIIVVGHHPIIEFKYNRNNHSI